MLEELKMWMAKFDELPVRERVVAVVGVLALLLFIIDFSLITPQEKKRKVLIQRVESQKLEREKISGELAVAARQLAQIARSAPVKEPTALEDLKQKIATTDAQIEQMVSKTPDTEALVKRVLDSSKGLTLLSLKTATVTRLSGVEPTPASGGVKPAPNQPLSIYRHPIDVGIQGNYLAVLAYLEKLQGNSRQLFWGDMRMTTADYPNSVFNLTLFTLATQPALIR